MAPSTRAIELLLALSGVLLISACTGLRFDSHIVHARILAEEGKHQEAIEEWTRLIAARPTYIEGYVNLAEAYQTIGHYGQSLEIIRKGIELEARPEFYLLAGQARYELKDYWGAIEEWTKLVEMQPYVGEHYFRLGSAHEAVANFPAALRFYNDAEERQDYSPEVQIATVRALIKAGQIGSAESEFDRSWKLVVTTDPKAHQIVWLCAAKYECLSGRIAAGEPATSDVTEQEERRAINEASRLLRRGGALTAAQQRPTTEGSGYWSREAADVLMGLYSLRGPVGWSRSMQAYAEIEPRAAMEARMTTRLPSTPWVKVRPVAGGTGQRIIIESQMLASGSFATPPIGRVEIDKAKADIAFGTALARSRLDAKWEDMLIVGDSAVVVGGVSGQIAGAYAGANAAYLGALLAAQSERSVEGMLDTARRFAEIGDAAMTTLSLQLAEKLAELLGDADAEEKVRAHTRELQNLLPSNVVAPATPAR